MTTPFHITLIPMRCDGQLTLARDGSLLLINGEAFDLSQIPVGAVLPRHAVSCAALTSDIEHRSDGLHLSLLLPHGAEAPQAARFPTPLHVTGDGPVDLPTSSTLPALPTARAPSATPDKETPA